MKYRLGIRFGLPLLLGVLLLPAAACAQQDASDAEAAFHQGRYEDAIRIGRAAVLANEADTGARQTLVRALFEVGRYEEVVEAAGDLHTLRGDALRVLGRLEEAESAYLQAVARGGADLRTAEFNLAEIAYIRGRRDEAMAAFDRFIDVYNESDRLSSPDLVAVGNAVKYLGIGEPGLFRDALMAFDEATREDPTDIEPHIRIGELFLEKYNGAEAREALNDALALNARNPRALLAMARSHVFEGQRGEAVQLVEQALDINPNLVAARVFLAEMLLDVEDHEAAEEELLRAIEVNPSSLEALSVLAGLYYIRDDQRRYEEIRSRVQRISPGYAGLNTKVADLAAKQRRYGDAAVLAEEATRMDPRAWDAYGVLGLNQFRLGRIDAAFASLERAFAGDPYNVWIKNNLDLLDTFSEYETIAVGEFEFMLHRNEADLLLPYLTAAAAEAHTELSRRYGDRSRGPIRIELYPRSADFSVRTVGLAGLGALGVSFGDVLALDSPSARQPGAYNWLTTLWHEMAHTITLGVSNSRVPRWLTEGLSVLEERKARPGWGDRITPEFLIAYDDDQLPPVSRLNEGFIRPPTPQHLGHAYDMASLVVEWVEETRGFEALVRMLHGYRDGRSTEQIFRSVMNASPEAIDAAFDTWLRSKVDPATARTFRQQVTEGQRQMQEGNVDQARRLLQAAGELFPVARGGSPYTLLAQLELREGNTQAAIAALERLTEYDETAYAANLELARLHEEQGNIAGAAAALERAVWIYPFEMPPHLKLAEFATALGDHQRAVRERRAIVALRPTDRASALYELARALFAAGDLQAARTEVLRALEVAPGFQDAQELLLQIHERS